MGRGVRRTTATTLGSRIRSYRERLGLTQTQLGAPDYDAPYVSSIEHDHHVPSLKALEVLAHDLGISVGDVLGGPPDPRSVPAALAQALHAVEPELRAAQGDRRVALIAVAFVLRLALREIAEDTN